MHRVLLVDDERPALQYLETIFQKYLPQFQTDLAESGEEALEMLSKQPFDVMITDISMIHGINGIELASQAHALYPQLHIMILSGYAEFDYARGALHAGVEEYLLKPISVKSVREMMEKLSQTLDSEKAMEHLSLLSDLMIDGHAEPSALARFFSQDEYRFAVARLGNAPQLTKLTSVSLLHGTAEGWTVLRGRDEQELIFVCRAKSLTGKFGAQVEEFLSLRSGGITWTAIYDTSNQPITSLPAFIEKAFHLLYSTLTIGLTQCLPITTKLPNVTASLPSHIRRQLEVFIEGHSMQRIKELFVSLAIEWENNRVPQKQLQLLCFQLITIVNEAKKPEMDKSLDEIYAEANDLYAHAATVGELLAGMYSILFNDSSSHDQRSGGPELCEHTLTYIRENYAKQLSIRQVCEKIGISQTYLSRLLRKYANTTVNTYLTQCRIEAAQQLLRDHPEMLLRDVAACVGYEDQSYFNKIFRAEVGMTPKQFATSQESKE